MTLVQHTPFDIELTGVTEPTRPWWMAREEPGPKWTFWRSGAFPVLQDKALIEEEGQT